MKYVGEARSTVIFDAKTATYGHVVIASTQKIKLVLNAYLMLSQNN